MVMYDTMSDSWDSAISPVFFISNLFGLIRFKRSTGEFKIVNNVKSFLIVLILCGAQTHYTYNSLTSHMYANKTSNFFDTISLIKLIAHEFSFIYAFTYVFINNKSLYDLYLKMRIMHRKYFIKKSENLSKAYQRVFKILIIELIITFIAYAPYLFFISGKTSIKQFLINIMFDINLYALFTVELIFVNFILFVFVCFRNLNQQLIQSNLAYTQLHEIHRSYIALCDYTEIILRYFQSPIIIYIFSFFIRTGFSMFSFFSETVVHESYIVSRILWKLFYIFTHVWENILIMYTCQMVRDQVSSVIFLLNNWFARLSLISL